MWWRKTATAQPGRLPARSTLAMALEPRMLFDGAVAATLAETAEAQPTADASHDQPSSQDAHSNTDNLAATPPGTADNRQEVVFIDNQVKNYQQLLSGLKPGSEVVVLDGSKDGLQQIADYLKGREGLDAIHILSHGDTGKIQLGNGWLDSNAIAANQAQLSTIGAALSENGDILLYGCNISAGDTGSELLNALAQATGADVAASVDDTGALSRGGNWVLEASSGNIETVTLNLGSFSGLLAAFNDNFSVNTGIAVSFSRMLGGVSFTYTFTGIGDGGDTFWKPSYGLADSASINLQSGDLQLGTTERFTITRTDGADFTFTSIYINNSGGETVTVAGYNDGVLVGAAQTVAKGADATLDFGGIGVDEVRITSVDFFQTSIDAFVGDTDPPAMAPSLTATGANPTFTENGTAVDLFGGVTASTNDAGQTFSRIALTVSNVSNGAAEILTISGTPITLTNGNSGNVAGGSYSVVVNSGTATITLSGLTLNNAAMTSLIDGITYHNTSDNPGSTARTITITQVTDSGSNNNTATPNISSAVTVVPVNDVPALSPANNVVAYTEGGLAPLLSPGITVADVDSTTFQSATITINDFRTGDVLSVGNASGLTVDYDDDTGVLTLTGPADAASLQTALRSISYSSSSDNPTFNGTDGTRQISFVVRDAEGANSAAVSAQVAVTGVNDAPTISAGPYNWAPTNEDTVSNTVTVATLLSNLSASDPDSPNLGIAITASSGSGTWKYSTDGNIWYSVGAVTSIDALLLSATTQLRFVPDGENGTTATISFRAWDQSSGSATTAATRNTANTTTNGGSSAFSITIAQATLDVSNVNDAPVLTPSTPTLATLTDSQVDNAGQTVASFIAGRVSDVDTGASSGIAITGTDPGNGSWQYSLDDGASWQDVGSVSTGSALLLRSTDRVRFVPDGVNGTTASITYRAWDQTGATSGQHGIKVAATVAGGSTPFSTGSDTASITVTAVNDAPLLVTSGGNAAFVEGDNVASTPVVIDAGITVIDSDSPLLYGATVQIISNLQAMHDVLGFTNDGATMGDIGAGYSSPTGMLIMSSSSGASAAQWQAALRAVTYSSNSENPNTGDRTVGFVIYDGELNSSLVLRTVTVTAVNDAPTIAMPALLTVAEDVAGAITGISFADADAGTNSVIVTLSVPSGALSAVSGGGVAVVGSASAMVLVGSISNINAFIAGGNVSYLGALNSTGSVTLSASINDNGLSGGAPRTISDTVQITITPVNDAPVVNAPASLLVTEDVPYGLTGISFSDVDIGAGTATVQLAASSGTLDGVSGSGVTIAGAGTGSVTLQGTLADINAWLANGSLSYTTALNATADATLQIDISDGSLTDSATVTLQVVAQNDAPVNSVPDTQTVLQDDVLVFNTAGGNAISISDVDAGGGTVQVTLTATQGLISLSGTSGLAFIVGNGSDDATMTFTGSINDINNALNGLTFTPASGYNGPASLQIVTNDLGLSGNGGNRIDSDTILIDVTLPNPTIVSVAALNPDDAYKIDDVIQIAVTFSQAVLLDISDGIPTLNLETGTIDRTAVYNSQPDSYTLVFSYLISSGDLAEDLDYLSDSALSLNGATLRNSNGLDALLGLPTPGTAGSLADNSDITVDGVRPTSAIVVADTALAIGKDTTVTITFNEAVTGLDLSHFTVANGSLSNLVTMDGGITWMATLTPDADVENSDNLISLDNRRYTDLAGNTGTGTSESNIYVIDTQAPGVAVVLDPSSSSTTGLHYTVTFSEDVNGVDLSDFSLVSRGNASGTISGLTQIDARTYQVSITGIRGYGSLALAINGSTAGISDPAGNTFNNEVIGLPYLLDNIEGDPEFRAYPPHTRPLSTNSDSTPDLGLPPIPPALSPSPLLPPSLFNTETLGSGIPPLGSIFVRNDPQAPSFIAQIFQGGDSSYGDGSGKGFLGFGGGDANVFGRSSLSALFDRNVPGEPDELEIHWGHKDGNGQESAGIAGAPTLGQQLQQIGESEQRQVKDLAWALGQIALQEPQA